jgi:cell division protein FtsZ
VNEIMNAIAEQFGRDSHIIMGAVIDEGMQGRVEISVLGTSDMGSRGAVAAPARAPGARASEEPAPKQEAIAPDAQEEPAVLAGPSRSRMNSGSARSRAAASSSARTATFSTARTSMCRPTSERDIKIAV